MPRLAGNKSGGRVVLRLRSIHRQSQQHRLEREGADFRPRPPSRVVPHLESANTRARLRLPQRHLVCIRRSERGSIRRERHSAHGGAMLEPPHLLARDGVPYNRETVRRAGDDEHARRTEGYGIQWAAVALEYALKLPSRGGGGAHAPQPRVAILRCRGEHPPVGRKTNGTHPVGVTGALGDAERPDNAPRIIASPDWWCMHIHVVCARSARPAPSCSHQELRRGGVERRSHDAPGRAQGGDVPW
mmetsp:Transcript_15362/g.50456  ORF Transcript_15362/g.50456 Transcript_15362/m.50456 type:complete len:245 (-) Transcript_15362:689-1423(-)